MPTGVGIRSLVEAVYRDRKAQGKDLKERIDDLVGRGFPTPLGADILQKLRLMGTAFDVVENLLRGVYIFPAEFG